MGIEYCLFKPKTNERYELGKGWGWSKIFPESPYNLDSYNSFYLTEINDYSLYINILCHLAPSFSIDTKLEYFYILAKDIKNWCGVEEIQFWREDNFNEIFWDIKIISYKTFEIKYPYTGSRYIERKK